MSDPSPLNGTYSVGSGTPLSVTHLVIYDEIDPIDNIKSIRILTMPT